MKSYNLLKSIREPVLVFLLILLFTGCSNDELVSEEHSFLLPDGPDKALLQNLYMVEDRNTHTYPFQRLETIKYQESKSRIASDRDFQWEQVDTKVPGRSRAMYYDQSTNILLTGSVSGGLWRNNDYKNNAEWEQIEGFSGTAVNCIAQDPLDGNILYLGTGESHTAFVNYRESTAVGNGIYVSEDNGESWSLISSTKDFYYINDIALRDEGGQSVLYVAAGSGTYETRSFVQEGLYRSADNGISWTQVLPAIDGENSYYQISDIEISLDGIMYISTMRNSENLGGSIVLSSSDGINWSVMYDLFNASSDENQFPGASLIKVAPSNSSHLYAVFSMGSYNSLDQLRDYESYLYQSVDGGNSWTEIQKPTIFTLPWHAMAMAVDPNDENKIILGGLDTYVLNDASTEAITELDWILLSYWYAKYYYDEETGEGDTFFKGKFVHADVHDIQFLSGNSDEVLITTDGGIFHSSNLSVTNLIDPENPVQEFPYFKSSPNGLNTTQYYHAALHPEKGRKEAIGGTQDNGSLFRNWESNAEYDLSGGDGGFNFFDRDDDNLRITMVYGNRYYIHIDEVTHFIGKYINGLFVNPVVYDDAANLLYSNAATSKYGGLYTGLKTRYYDTIQIVNVNKYLQTPGLGLDTVSFLNLNAGLTEAITALKLYENSSSLNKTLYFGTENGKVFRSEGLPYEANTTRIDNQLPIGYISSIDVGDDDENVVVVYSNFGIQSVWSTVDGGENWTNIERNLPDMPVRWVRYNPGSDNKLMIATEVGIWGLEDIASSTAQWFSYDDSFPQIRVDMFDLRESDSTILAATHGQGLIVGTYFQGKNEERPLNVDKLEKIPIAFYPNPVKSFITLTGKSEIVNFQLFDLQGNLILEKKITPEKKVDLSSLKSGLYLIRGFNIDGSLMSTQKIVKE